MGYSSPTVKRVVIPPLRSWAAFYCLFFSFGRLEEALFSLFFSLLGGWKRLSSPLLSSLGGWKRLSSLLFSLLWEAGRGSFPLLSPFFGRLEEAHSPLLVGTPWYICPPTPLLVGTPWYIHPCIPTLVGTPHGTHPVHRWYVHHAGC